MDVDVCVSATLLVFVSGIVRALDCGSELTILEAMVSGNVHVAIKSSILVSCLAPASSVRLALALVRGMYALFFDQPGSFVGVLIAFLRGSVCCFSGDVSLPLRYVHQ